MISEEIENIPSSTDAKKSKKQNKDFIMMYRRFINQVAELGAKDPIALKVLLFLVRNMDNRNALAITVNLISSMSGMCRQTVSKKIKYLEANGWIFIYKIGHEKVYVINPDVVWTSYADDRKYCKFDAKIILDCKDNWDVLSKDKQIIKHIEKDILDKCFEQI